MQKPYKYIKSRRKGLCFRDRHNHNFSYKRDRARDATVLSPDNDQ
jgi:hypothetical protein